MLGNLAILFQDFEKSRSVCISNSDKSPLGGGVVPQQLHKFTDTGCQSLRRHRDQFSFLQEVETR